MVIGTTANDSADSARNNRLQTVRRSMEEVQDGQVSPSQQLFEVSLFKLS